MKHLSKTKNKRSTVYFYLNSNNLVVAIIDFRFFVKILISIEVLKQFPRMYPLHPLLSCVLFCSNENDVIFNIVSRISSMRLILLLSHCFHLELLPIVISNVQKMPFWTLNWNKYSFSSFFQFLAKIS